MKLRLLDATFAVCRLPRTTILPDWIDGEFAMFSVEETCSTVVCETRSVPRDVERDDGWRGIKVIGPLDFSLVGVISRLTSELAKREIPVFVTSTFDTDYVLIKSEHIDSAVQALKNVGYEFN